MAHRSRESFFLVYHVASEFVEWRSVHLVSVKERCHIRFQTTVGLFASSLKGLLLELEQIDLVYFHGFLGVVAYAICPFEQLSAFDDSEQCLPQKIQFLGRVILEFIQVTRLPFNFLLLIPANL